MSIDKDDKSRPRVETEVEIQATPEAVWNAMLQLGLSGPPVVRPSRSTPVVS